MPVFKSDASLRGQIKNIAAQNNLRAQEVLQMYLFERLLLRLAKSDYANKFVLKGGLLISSMIGLAQRTTMDMDTTVMGLAMDEQSICAAIASICHVPLDDGMDYSFERIEPIHENCNYANWRAHIRVRYGRIDAPIKVDITTGDSITPGQMLYSYPTMFSDEAINVMAYPPETILAEKFETIVSRGTANTRTRDYYDIYALSKSWNSKLDSNQLRHALESTATKRGSLNVVVNYEEELAKVKASKVMQSAWAAYIQTAPYVARLGFDEVIDASIQLGNFIYQQKDNED